MGTEERADSAGIYVKDQRKKQEKQRRIINLSRIVHGSLLFTPSSSLSETALFALRCRSSGGFVCCLSSGRAGEGER